MYLLIGVFIGAMLGQLIFIGFCNLERKYYQIKNEKDKGNKDVE